MKIAFLVLNHRHPAQLIRLLTTIRLQLPEAPIVVHNDKFREDLPRSILKPIGNVQLLTAHKPITWGDFSVVDAYRWSLTWMMEYVEFDWVVLLSAQDYPIKPLSGLGNYLAENDADALLRAVPITELTKAAARRDMRRRYFYQYKPATMHSQDAQISDNLRNILRRRTGGLVDVINILQPYFKIYRLPDRMPYRVGCRAHTTPFEHNRPCWHGPMWFSLSRHATEFVLTYMCHHPEYVDYYRRTIIPDESIIATLIYNAPNLRVENRDVHYTRWTHSRTGHPDIFKIEDLPELIATPEYFARKFDIAKDSRILDRLDEINHGINPMQVRSVLPGS